MTIFKYIKYEMSVETVQSQIDLNFDKDAKEYKFINTLKELQNLDWKPSDGVWWKKNNKPNKLLTKQQMWQIWNTMDNFTIQKREELYLSNHEKLSEVEYDRLFSWKERLQQWQLGDCYLVSWIHQLANVQYFDTLMRTSIQRMKWKNWDLWYQIQIPLWEPSWRKILLKDSELNVAKIRGNNWYMLLELAYAKNRRPNNKKWNAYSPITSGELQKIQGWWTHEVLQTFLGKNNVWFNDFWTMNNYKQHKTLSQSSQTAKTEIHNFLKNYSPSIWNRFVSLGSLLWSSDSRSYTVWWKTLYRKHAYSLTWVKKDDKWNIKSITVLNPWNKEWEWKNYQDFTLNEFLQAFSCMSCWKIKTKEFLNEKSLAYN